MSTLSDAEKPGAENFCYESRESQNSCAKCRPGENAVSTSQLRITSPNSLAP
jgi:hypothetical protein